NSQASCPLMRRYFVRAQTSESRSSPSLRTLFFRRPSKMNAAFPARVRMQDSLQTPLGRYGGAENWQNRTQCLLSSLQSSRRVPRTARLTSNRMSRCADTHPVRDEHLSRQPLRGQSHTKISFPPVRL